MHVIFQLHNDDLHSTTDELRVYNNITQEKTDDKNEKKTNDWLSTRTLSLGAFTFSSIKSPWVVKLSWQLSYINIF